MTKENQLKIQVSVRKDKYYALRSILIKDEIPFAVWLRGKIDWTVAEHEKSNK